MERAPEWYYPTVFTTITRCCSQDDFERDSVSEVLHWVMATARSDMIKVGKRRFQARAQQLLEENPITRHPRFDCVRTGAGGLGASRLANSTSYARSFGGSTFKRAPSYFG